MASSLFKQTIDKTSAGYKVILSYLQSTDSSKNPETMYAELDLQEGGVSVKSDVELTDHPTANGYNISDHVYRKPITMSLKGQYAENGSKAINWTGNDRLTTIQTEFEALQRAGAKFKIVTMKNSDASDDSNKRFIARSNMVLTSISWTQAQDSLSFDFSFKEAISSNTVLIEAEKDVRDPTLPAITELKPCSIFNELISEDDFLRLVIKSLQDLDLVDAKTLKYLGASYASKVIAGLAVAAVVGTLYICATMSLTIPVVGILVTAVVAIAAAVVSAICWWKAAEHEKQLLHYKALGHYFKIDDGMTDDEKNAIIVNLGTFLTTAKENVNAALSNINIYGIAKDDRQEFALTMNGNYYIQQLELANAKCTASEKKYTIKSLYLGDSENASMPEMTGLASYDQGTDKDSTIYFRDLSDSKYRAYIVNKASSSAESKGKTVDDDLMNYDIVVAPYALSNITDKISASIKDSIE